MKLFQRLLVATSLFALFTASALWAQDQEEVSGPGPAPNQTQNQNNDSAQDPPGRAARLQYIQGSVSVQPAGTGDWVEGALNRPLTNADNIWTDKNARTELNVGSGILRLNSESSLTLTNVGDNSVQVQLHQGTLNLRVRKLYDGEIYEVDTPNMAFTVQKSGEYRFDVNPDGDSSVVTVFKGQGDATGEGPAVHVKDHERARFHEGQSLAHEFSPAPGYDGFDDWCRVRDKREGTISAQYVAPEVVGYEDLDEYGTWSEVPEYGHIWRPRVSVGWAPYREGHWAYIGLWGWTWVDDSPWGYAPFHYGRWVNYDGYWGWAPGPRYIRPVYAPALVTWFGGAGWGVGLGFGGGYGYGWCPLGWGEPYRPWYHYSRGYFGRVNYSNTRINNVYNYYGRNDNNFRYANMRYAGGRTAASRENIIGSRPIGRSFVNVPERNFQNSHLGGRMDLAPDRNSRLGVNAGRAAAVPPQRAFSRPVASRMTAPGRSERADSNRGTVGVNNRSEGRPQGGESNGRFVPRPGATNSNAGQARGNDRNGGFNARNDTRQSGQNEARNNRSFVPRPGANAPGANEARTANTARTPNSASEPNRGFQGQRNESGANQSVRSNSGNNNVPRPTAGVRTERSDAQRSESTRSNQSVRTAPSQNAPSNRGAERSTPRPAENGGARNSERQSGGQRNSGRPDGGHSYMSVPRPSGQVRSASSYYGASTQTRGESSARSYGGNSRESYGSARSSGSYSASNRSYGQSGRSYSEPSRSYSSAGQRSYSQPSSSQRSMGSSGGGGRYSAPSGGGGRQSGGGSFHGSSGGGGGGGARSSGGGGGRHGH